MHLGTKLLGIPQIVVDCKGIPGSIPKFGAFFSLLTSLKVLNQKSPGGPKFCLGKKAPPFFSGKKASKKRASASNPNLFTLSKWYIACSIGFAVGCYLFFPVFFFKGYSYSSLFKGSSTKPRFHAQLEFQKKNTREILVQKLNGKSEPRFMVV